MTLENNNELNQNNLNQTPSNEPGLNSNPNPAPASSSAPGAGSLDQGERRLLRKKVEEAAYWRGVAEGRGGKSVSQSPSAQDPPPPPKPLVAPKAADFNSLEEYERAKDEYLVDYAKRKALDEFESNRKKADADNHQRNIDSQFNERVQQYSKIDPEITDILNDPTLPASDAMVVAVKESELGPQMLRYLSDNRKEALRIFNMSPTSAMRALGKIESKIEAKNAGSSNTGGGVNVGGAGTNTNPNPGQGGNADPNASPTQDVDGVNRSRVSNAPAPIQTLKPGGDVEVDLENLPMEEYVKVRNKQRRARR